MMKFSNLSQDAVAELLVYLAENEKFQSLKGIKGVGSDEVREVFHEIASQLRQDSPEDTSHTYPPHQEHELSEKALSLVSCLSPREELLLFRSFKLIDR